MKKIMKHIVLLGDSIFDNSPYVETGELDVPNQLRTLVKSDCEVTHLAVDGDVISDIRNQLRRLPSDVTHLFVSVGGNDGLGHLSIFNEPVDTIGAALKKMYLVGEPFQKNYSEMVDLILSHNLPTTFCSIYYPRFHSRSLNRVVSYLSMMANGETLQQMAMAAETIFNDIITFEIFKRKLPLIDLRVLCDEDQDFANPIEPSCIGGMKIAKTIKEVVLSHDFSHKTSTIYC